MKRTLLSCVVGMLLSFGLASPSQAKTMKLLDAFVHQDGKTRYVAVFDDNSLSYYVPKRGWFPLGNKNYPAGKKIVLLSAFTKRVHGSRYVAAMSDQSMYWYNAKTGWTKVVTKGLPRSYRIKTLRGFEGRDGLTRYVALFASGDAYYYVGGRWNVWTKIKLKGL